MESLSREIGVRTAEIELLRSRKAQEIRLADTQLENAHRELQLKLDELNKAKVRDLLLLISSVVITVGEMRHLELFVFQEELSSVRQERDRLNSEIQSTRQSSSLHPVNAIYLLNLLH